MKLLLSLAVLLSSQVSSAGDSPHDLAKCQQLLQHYNEFWRHDASEYLYRMLDRDLFWKFTGKDADPEISGIFLQGRSRASEFKTRLRVIKDTLTLEVRNLRSAHVLLHELGPSDLVTHTESTIYGNKGDDHDQINSLAFAVRSYAKLHYPIVQTQDLVLSVQVLPYQVDESFFLGRRTRCTDPKTIDYWFNSQGEKFCFKSLAQLTTSPY